MSTVKLDFDNLGSGDEVEVAHLGVFPNGKTSDVTDEQVQNWEAQTGQEWPKAGLELPVPPVEEPKDEPAPTPATAATKKGGSK
jgi:hypothetical protein